MARLTGAVAALAYESSSASDSNEDDSSSAT